ncbi:MAG: hypothetical protein Ct9H300mP25_06220 [Acidobacteriota bacterium]|nr:MAG: hypothetical protein Ct9H300mP25_06220 [Acidobacteriota bacterium]
MLTPRSHILTSKGFVVRPTYPDRLFLSGFKGSWFQTGGFLVHRASQL